MTYEEAISELVVIKSVYSNMRVEYKPCVEALQMAIDLLRQADTPQADCDTCRHYKLACELFSEICKYEPKQTDCPCNNCQEFDCYGCEYKQINCD